MTTVFAQNRPMVPIVSTKKAIYRLLQKGDLLQAKDAVYCPADDYWKAIPDDIVGTPYRSKLGPVRRFNK
ncbi:hypothetical protein GCM10028805_47460 [Spirosoma harenae]